MDGQAPEEAAQDSGRITISESIKKNVDVASADVV